jgi:trigger factor
MQVVEVSAEGLKRQYRVTIPAAEIESRVTTRLEGLGRTVKVPGFRPGKVPLALLRRQYGRSVMGEILEQAVDEGSKRVVEEHKVRPALKPKVEVTTFDEGKDLEFAIDLEVLPEVPKVDLGAIALTRLVAPVEEGRVAGALERLATSRQRFEAPEPPRPAAKGDRVVIDFAGTIEGAAFEGGSGTAKL